MANATNAVRIGNLVNSTHPLPDATVATTASFVTAIQAAGTTQADATPVSAQLNRVTNNTASNGLILPVGIRGQQVIIYPALATNAPKIYPPVGGTVAGGAVNANTTAAAQMKTAFYCLDDTGLNWF